MRKTTFALATAALALVAGAVQAEGMMMTPSTTNPDAPVEGRNSFTEAQAKSQFVAAGYTNVTTPMKGDDGVWRATARKGGKSHKVSLDYQGNITMDK